MDVFEDRGAEMTEPKTMSRSELRRHAALNDEPVPTFDPKAPTITRARIAQLLKEYESVTASHDRYVLVSDPEASLFAALTVRELRELGRLALRALDAEQQIATLTAERDEAERVLRNNTRSVAEDRDQFFAEKDQWRQERLTLIAERDQMRKELRQIYAVAFVVDQPAAQRISERFPFLTEEPKL